MIKVVELVTEFITLFHYDFFHHFKLFRQFLVLIKTLVNPIPLSIERNFVLFDLVFETSIELQLFHILIVRVEVKFFQGAIYFCFFEIIWALSASVVRFEDFIIFNEWFDARSKLLNIRHGVNKCINLLQCISSVFHSFKSKFSTTKLIKCFNIFFLPAVILAHFFLELLHFYLVFFNFTILRRDICIHWILVLVESVDHLLDDGIWVCNLFGKECFGGSYFYVNSALLFLLNF